ncbi:hypothetical protein Tco_1233208, partial [Tanacetum coccineum]
HYKFKAFETHHPPIVNAGEFVTGGNVQDNDVVIAIEGHGDNEDHLLEDVEKPVREKVMLEVEASYSAGRFGNLPFTPQWGLTDSYRMDNSRLCRDIMLNLFTLADNEFFNEGVRNESAIKRSCKLLCQSAQQQANSLLRFEAFTEDHANLVYAHKSCKDLKARYKECRKELAKAQSDYDEKTSAYDQLYAVEAGNGEMVRRQIINQYLLTFVRRLHQSVEYKQSFGEAFSLAIGKCFIDGISIGHKDLDVQAILKATPNVNPTSLDIFMETYEKLFDKRYPYVDKVARMYLLDPSGLQNVMPDETGPTLGEGPRDTSTASFA